MKVERLAPPQVQGLITAGRQIAVIAALRDDNPEVLVITVIAA